MTGLNIFVGKSQAWLEEQLAKAQADYASGRVLTSVSAGDTSTGKLVQVNIRDRISALLVALNALDPTTYPASSLRISRTRITFS